MNLNRNAEKGFTLVEISIVIVIIGLLIGGVLKGGTLIETSRVKRMVADLGKVRAASLTFQDIYKAMPGDMRSATSAIPDCTAANFCANGDSNGYVASDGTDQYVWTSVVVGATPQAFESIQFWKHLQMADLINGMDIHADPSAPAFGRTHLGSTFGDGGFEFYYDGATTLFPTGSHFLRLSGASALTGGPIVGNVTPSQAERIDRAMDDGFPNSGYVVANYALSRIAAKQADPSIQARPATMPIRQAGPAFCFSASSTRPVAYCKISQYSPAP